MCSVGCASLQKGIIHNCILVHFIIYLISKMMFNLHPNYIHLFITFKKDNWHVNMPSTSLLVRTVRRNTDQSLTLKTRWWNHFRSIYSPSGLEVVVCWLFLSNGGMSRECVVLAGNAGRVADGCSCGLPVVPCMFGSSLTTAHASKLPVSSDI